MAARNRKKGTVAEQPPWEELPALCWEAVLRRLNSVEDLESVSSVCKQFLHISNTSRTCLSITNRSAPHLGSLLRRFSSLKSIDLRSFRGNPSSVLLEIARFPLPLDRLNLSNQESLRFDGLREVGSKFGALRVLVLSNVGLRGGNADLVSIAESFPSLEELDISCPRRDRSARVTDDGISALSGTLKRLSRIDVSGNRFLSDQSLVVLSVNCPYLRAVEFRGCELITGRGAASLIKNTPQLASLALIGMKEEVIFFEELVDSFRHARGLTSLDFSSSFIWDGLLMSVAEANIPLKSLLLSCTLGFSFDGIQKIMLKHRGIKHLNFVAVDFLTDRDMSMICKDLCSLTYINISHCSNLTMTTLYNLMRQCPFLMAITMETTNLGKDNANETDIVYLDVSDCLKITGNGISGVLKSCPKIRYLEIRGLKNIRNLCIDFELPQLEVLEANDLKLNNEQLTAFISRCRHLKNLDLVHCVHLSTEGVEKVVKNCNELREINLRDCHNVRDDIPFLDWMVSVRPSLRRIVPSCGLVSSEMQDFFLQRGLSYQ
ncbi:hypothetical protein BT93_G0202 [Corymbia citriodora subsp. variegata]|nr:hypothetical protein BT93_G0202 [Corymbia citriodora subsp. variegata]KAF8019444.1 hypothetical protein BT93_G0202 [Corymbia citriodora subsp. variegata]